MTKYVDPDKVGITAYFGKTPDKYSAEYSDTFQKRYDVLQNRITEAIVESGLDVLEIQITTF